MPGFRKALHISCIYQEIQQIVRVSFDSGITVLAYSRYRGLVPMSVLYCISGDVATSLFTQLTP
jgi:hypothetical protein